MYSKKNNYFSRLKSAPDFKYLKRLTNKIGIIQHARGEKLNRKFGYCIDDNARALILAVLAFRIYQKNEFLILAHKYLNFISRMQKKDGTFHNFLSYNLKYQDIVGSEDSFGRTIWALGVTIFENIDSKLTTRAVKIFQKAKIHILKLQYLRSRAFTLIGLKNLYLAQRDSEIQKLVKILAEDLNSHLLKNQSQSWCWFEDILTYANGLLPFALFSAYKILGNKKYLISGFKSFNFLLAVCRHKKIPAAIGQKGWYKRGGKKSLFDQQLIDIFWMINTSCEAYKLTKKLKYKKEARDWFFWFWGNNLLGKEMIDFKTGGAYDGLKPTKRNKNQGAESIISYLLAFLTLKQTFKITSKELSSI